MTRLVKCLRRDIVAYTPKARWKQLATTSLRVYKINTLYTRQLYNYLPSNKQVSSISIYVARKKKFNINKKNESDV